MELRKSSLSGARCGGHGSVTGSGHPPGCDMAGLAPSRAELGRGPSSPCPGARLPAASPAPPRAGSRPGGRRGDPAAPGSRGCPRWRPWLWGGRVIARPRPRGTPHSHPLEKPYSCGTGCGGSRHGSAPPLLPAAGIPKSSSFPPRAAQPGGSLLEGLVNNFGWQVEGRGLRSSATPGRGLGPSVPPQGLLETPDSERATGPVDHLPNWPINQLTSQLPKELTH